MLATMMLFGAQVIAIDGSAAVVRPFSSVDVGQTLTVQRLQHAPGAPGRPPFFRWTPSGTARVTAVRPDGTADVRLVNGSAAAGDRVN